MCSVDRNNTTGQGAGRAQESEPAVQNPGNTLHYVLARVIWCWVGALLVGASSARPQNISQNPPGQLPTNPKAQELLDHAIQALGGQAFLNFKTMTTTGRIFSISEESTAALDTFESAIVFPDKRRLTIGKKKPVILINDGDRAWEIDRYGLTKQLPEQLRRWKLSTRYSLENLLRLHSH